MEVRYDKLWGIWLILNWIDKKWEILQTNKVKILAVFGHSKAAIRWMAHCQLCPGQCDASLRNNRVQVSFVNEITTHIQSLLGASSISETAEADHPLNVAPEVSGNIVTGHTYSSAFNISWKIYRARTTANAHWEVYNCNMLIGYRLNGEAGILRPLPIGSALLLATRFCQILCQNVLTGACRYWFVYSGDITYWWYGTAAAQTQKYVLCHCSVSKNSCESYRVWRETQEAWSQCGAGGHG